jgi:hypothetical protein
MNDEVIYQKHEVFIHEKITDLPNNEVNNIGGSLQIIKNVKKKNTFYSINLCLKMLIFHRKMVIS